jgi:restriction system protein
MTSGPVAKAGGPAPMSFTDAAEAVLRETAKGRPMHYRAMLEEALDRGWLVTTGKTPELTLYVSLVGEIDRATKRGDQPRFTRFPRGYFGLSAWSKSGLDAEIDAQNAKARAELLERLHSVPPSDFEGLVRVLLGELGFTDLVVTRAHKDGGIDVRGTLVVGDVIRTSMAIQVKRWRQNVQAPIVQQVRGALGTHDQGLIITTSDFGVGAKREASRTDAVPVALMNGQQLVALLVEHEIGVKRLPRELLTSAPFLTEEDAEAAPPPPQAPSGRRNLMTLHAAMVEVLREVARPMKARDLAAEINRLGLYHQRDGAPAPIGQIHARAHNYPELFERTPQGIQPRGGF